MQQCLNSVRNFLVVIVNIMYNELPLLNTFTINDPLITRLSPVNFVDNQNRYRSFKSGFVWANSCQVLFDYSANHFPMSSLAFLTFESWLMFWKCSDLPL